MYHLGIEQMFRKNIVSILLFSSLVSASSISLASVHESCKDFMSKQFGASPSVHVLEFHPGQSNIQQCITAVYQAQKMNEFGRLLQGDQGAGNSGGYVFLFHKGDYNVDIPVGYYTQVLGLDVLPTGTTMHDGTIHVDNITDPLQQKPEGTRNFWRSAENISVDSANTDIWAVSQGVSLRRVYIKNNINLYKDEGENTGWVSGGFMADSIIDGKIDAGNQQQWIARNSSWKQSHWPTGMNIRILLGDQGPGAPTSSSDYGLTPTVVEKPFLIYLEQARDGYAKGFYVEVPPVKTNSLGPDWKSSDKDVPISTLKLIKLSDFKVVHPGEAVDSINEKLNSSSPYIIFTPGVYQFSKSIKVTKDNTLLLGLGVPTVKAPAPTQPIIQVNNAVKGVKIAGLILDAGHQGTASLLTLGDTEKSAGDEKNPSLLSDVYCRVGGDQQDDASNPITAGSCVTINNNNVILDNVWLWRADHDFTSFEPRAVANRYTGWDKNKADTALIVHGDHVTSYGLAVEHFQGDETLWTGDAGTLFFYQSELPYDVPSSSVWNGGKGYASFNLKGHASGFNGYGMGVYAFFHQPINEAAAIYIADTSKPIVIKDAMDWLMSNGSVIKHVINDKGNTLTEFNTKATASW